jgi:hypothetical protein
MERRRHGWNTRIPDGEANFSLESFESDLTEWVRADREEKLR